MTDHAKCPECGAEAIVASSNERSKKRCQCLQYRGRHWRGPWRDTAFEALAAWDKVVGAYWREREYEKFVAKHRIGPAPQELQDHDRLQRLELRVAELERAVNVRHSAPKEPPRRECWEVRYLNGAVSHWNETEPPEARLLGGVTKHRMVEVGEGEHIVRVTRREVEPVTIE